MHRDAVKLCERVGGTVDSDCIQNILACGSVYHVCDAASLLLIQGCYSMWLGKASRSACGVGAG